MSSPHLGLMRYAENRHNAFTMRLGSGTRVRLWVVLLVSFALAGCASNNSEGRPFFQHEYGVQSHGRKTILDRLVETDPGGFKVQASPAYSKDPPARIAVLPFSDVGSANFVVDKIQLTHRDKIERANWAWTDSQRLRRSFDGYLSEREFIVMPLGAVDAVLRARRIDTPEQLNRVSPEELGRLLGVDAVVYGTVLHYEAYYFLLVAAWQVAVEVTIVSTHDGDNLIKAEGSRYAVSAMPAFSAADIVINSAENLFQLRDIVLARAEEEACREIVRRIPRSPELESHIEQDAMRQAEEVSVADPPALVQPQALSVSETGILPISPTR